MLKIYLCSLFSLAGNLAEGLHNDKCKICKSCLEYIKIKDKFLIFNCSHCNRNYENQFDKDLTKRFGKTYEFCQKEVNKFYLMLRKGVYPYKYMNVWKRFDQISLPDKKEFYSSSFTENIIDDGYKRTKKIWKDFKIKKPR